MDTTLYNRHVICVDSRNRENFANTTPSNYEFRTPILQNVKQVRLITAEIPNTEYIFNATNNIIDFNDIAGLGIVSATITPGTYTANNLANEINTQMNAALGVGMGIIFTVTYLTDQQHFQIDRVDGNTFTLLWATGANTLVNAHYELGFENTDSAIGITSDESDLVVKLSGENFVYLCLKDMGTLFTGENNVQDAFAKIIFNVPPRAYSFDSFSENARIYSTPLARIDRLYIKFNKYDGVQYDFNTVEHSFSLEVFTL